ncbi:MAG: tetratricopeptide repeat protein [Nitrospira sp.]|nr:tetratricopeptide repeat protein [Nitrospira sp.]
MKQVVILGMIIALMGTTGCFSKRKPLVPLALADVDAKSQAVLLTEQGTQAYHAKQFEEAKKLFEQAVSVAPQSGQAHYNYGLALNALGKQDVARQHFLEAANLAPGDQVIWDSPALAPYGDPETRTRTKDRPYGTNRPNFGAPLPRY